MKTLWQAGDRSRAICGGCEKIVDTRFEHRAYTIVELFVEVPDVLVAVCVECDRIVAVPYQSTPRVNEARKQAMERVDQLSANG